MCGISGICGLANHDVIARMNSAQAHRGPDDQGIYIDKANQMALGHRRLAIIDLSPAGHQPMSYADGRYWITYNGEVYNFTEIREELEILGHTFHSNTDTEVILAAYAQWGEACLDRFRGMFAFAIWDTCERRLFLARDRFGIKPLYYAQINNGVFLFASELKGVLASGLISRRLDRQAIWDYLSLSSVPPPRTILSEVSALLPGHYMIVEQGQIKVEQYWDLCQSSADGQPLLDLTPQETEQELRRLLEESTRLRLIADVPVGAFLSGGIDSTAVVGLMSQYVDEPLKTYSIGFEGKGTHISELKWARIAAERFGTDHSEIIITGQDVVVEFDQLISAIDQPSNDGINTYFIARYTRTGVTVALSGLGGDELFAGYSQFRWLKSLERVSALRGWFLVREGADLVQSRLSGRWKKAAELVAGPLARRYAVMRRAFNEQEKYNLISNTFQDGDVLRCDTDLFKDFVRPELDVVARTTYVETKGYMAHTLLRDTDAMSMAHALEVRVPLLDHVLAEFVFRLPPEMKLNGRDTKVILVRALRDLLPEPIVRRSKMGFNFPLGYWLAGPLQSRVHDLLNSEEARQLFSPAGIALLQREAADERSPYTRAWAPIVLIAWMRRHGCTL